MNDIAIAGNLRKYGFHQADAVYSVNGISPTIIVRDGIGHQINILEEDEDDDNQG